MCSGIALAYSEVPVELMDRHGLQARVCGRGGEKEVRFLYRAVPRLIPVWHEGQFRIVRWGCRRGQSKALPCTGWTWQRSVEAGRWAEWQAEPVEIPAPLGLEGGVWFRIRFPIRGLLVKDERRTIDELTRHCTLPAGELARLLMGLKLKKVIRRLPGNWYERC